MDIIDLYETRHKAYFDRFHKLLAELGSPQRAYEAVEAEREADGYPRKYLHYQSFRVARHYHLTNLKNVKVLPKQTESLG